MYRDDSFSRGAELAEMAEEERRYREAVRKWRMDGVKLHAEIAMEVAAAFVLVAVSGYCFLRLFMALLPIGGR